MRGPRSRRSIVAALLLNLLLAAGCASNPSPVPTPDASAGPVIDGPWEKYPGNPVIAGVANNWGIGHADIVIVGPATYLYTATSQTTRGRYVLVREKAGASSLLPADLGGVR